MICLFVSQTQVYMTPMWSTRHQWTRSLRTHSLSLSRRLCPLSLRISADIGSLSTGGMTYQGKVSVLCALIVVLDINNQYIYIFFCCCFFLFVVPQQIVWSWWRNAWIRAGGSWSFSHQIWDQAPWRQSDGLPHPKPQWWEGLTGRWELRQGLPGSMLIGLMTCDWQIIIQGLVKHPKCSSKGFKIGLHKPVSGVEVAMFIFYAVTIHTSEFSGPQKPGRFAY